MPFPPPTVVPFDPKIWDANPSTFYSALSNVDVEIGAGNPAATAVRFRIAQHGYLSNMDFKLGSGFAGIYQAGNVRPQPAFPWRSLWHRDRKDLARLAVYASLIPLSTARRARRSASMRRS